jgi:hypothetical protein
LVFYPVDWVLGQYLTIKGDMMKALKILFTLVVLVALFAMACAAGAAPKIGFNFDGQSYYYNSAFFSNMAGNFDPQNNLSYLNGYPDGDFKATWSGPAPTITGGGNSYLEVTGAGQGIFHKRSDPGGGGIWTLQRNGANNIQVLAADAVQGTPFRKAFLDKVDRALTGRNSVVRYMDWMGTTGSGTPVGVVEWADRPQDFYYTRHQGVPYENIVALSNHAHADAWVNIPVKASDDYIRQFARYLKANLKPTLRVHIEYGNELWNGGDQANGTWNLQQARNDPTLTESSDTARMAQRSADQHLRAVTIFNSEFNDPKRVVPVLGGFIANEYWTYWMAERLKAKGVDLRGEKTGQKWHVAVAPYAPGSENDLGELSGDSADVIFSKLRSFIDKSLLTWVDRSKNMADYYGLTLDSYEAAVGSFYGQRNLATHIAMQDDPRLGELEKYLITEWDRRSGGGVWNVFGLVSPETEWGQWGLFDDVNKTSSVKWDAVTSLIPNSVPEPSGLAAIAVGCCLCRRRR